jgi:hypothetical protein
MKIKINKNSRRLENKTPNILENAIDKLSTNKKRNIFRFLTINNHSSPTTLVQTQLRSNLAVVIEAEHQQCNGLLYANITRFR